MTFTLLSGISLSVIGFYLLLGKSFKKHPYRLLALACIFESALFLNWTKRISIVQFRLHKIFILTWHGGDLSDYSLIYGTLKKFIISWKIIFAVLLQLTIITNGLIYIDLYLTLINPFYPRHKRAPKYYLVLLIVLVMASSISYYTYTHNTL